MTATYNIVSAPILPIIPLSAAEFSLSTDPLTFCNRRIINVEFPEYLAIHAVEGAISLSTPILFLS